jgi:hypothetical protein
MSRGEVDGRAGWEEVRKGELREEGGRRREEERASRFVDCVAKDMHASTLKPNEYHAPCSFLFLSLYLLLPFHLGIFEREEL